MTDHKFSSSPAFLAGRNANQWPLRMAKPGSESNVGQQINPFDLNISPISQVKNKAIHFIFLSSFLSVFLSSGSLVHESIIYGYE